MTWIAPSEKDTATADRIRFGFVIANSNSVPRAVAIMVVFHGQLFYSKQIPACLWFLAKNIAPTPNAASATTLRLMWKG